MKGINVLAVMEIDALHAWQSRHGDPDIQKEFGEESAEARAAVAELIEAAVEYLESGDARGRLKAALSRVKGESE